MFFLLWYSYVFPLSSCSITQLKVSVLKLVTDHILLVNNLCLSLRKLLTYPVHRFDHWRFIKDSHNLFNLFSRSKDDKSLCHYPSNTSKRILCTKSLVSLIHRLSQSMPQNRFVSGWRQQTHLWCRHVQRRRHGCDAIVRSGVSPPSVLPSTDTGYIDTA